MAMGATSGQIVPVDPNALRWTLARIARAGRKPGALWRSGAVDDRRQRRGCLGAPSLRAPKIDPMIALRHE
jgi:hypothetical protein